MMVNRVIKAFLFCIGFQNMLIFVLIYNGCCSRAQVTVSSEPKYFIWVSNKAGLFSQLLQMKIAAIFAERKCNRFIAIAPVKSTHFYK